MVEAAPVDMLQVFSAEMLHQAVELFFHVFAKFHIDLQLEVKTDEFETNIISQHFCIPSVTARPLPADEEFFVETFRLK